MITATGLLNGPGHYLHWGVVRISLANLIVLLVMIVVFVLALLLPFPHRDDAGSGATDDER